MAELKHGNCCNGPFIAEPIPHGQVAVKLDSHESPAVYVQSLRMQDDRRGDERDRILDEQLPDDCASSSGILAISGQPGEQQVPYQCRSFRPGTPWHGVHHVRLRIRVGPAEAAHQPPHSAHGLTCDGSDEAETGFFAVRNTGC